MACADTILTGLTANVTLPGSINMKVNDGQLTENFREKDDEGFDDAGFGSGKLTGQRLTGSIMGWVKASGASGMGTKQECVAITFTASTGRTVVGSFNITQFKFGIRVGELTSFSADVASVGTYTVTV